MKKKCKQGILGKRLLLSRVTLMSEKKFLNFKIVILRNGKYMAWVLSVPMGAHGRHT